MALGSLHILDTLIVVSYIISCIVIGFYKSRQIKNIKEYTIGSGTFPDIVLFSTIFATWISAQSTIGAVERIHKYGMLFAVAIMFVPCMWYLMIRVYANNIEQFRGCISITDIMAKLYGVTGRWITNTVAIFLGIGVVAAQCAALGHMCHYFFDLQYNICVIIGMSILVLYSAVGGIRAVALTDVFQICIFMTAMPLACSLAFHEAGGLDNIINKINKFAPHMLEFNLDGPNALFFFCTVISYGFLPPIGGAYIQRLLIPRRKQQLINCLYKIMLSSIPFALLICSIGFVIKAISPEIEPNVAFIHFLSTQTAVGIRGLLIAGVLAVIMSTADSWLNYTGVLCAHDIFKRIFPRISTKRELFLARLSTCFIGFMAIILATSIKSITSLSWLAANFWSPIIFIPMIAGFFGMRTKPSFFIISTICAVSFTLITAYIFGEFTTISLIFGIIGSSIGLFSTHYICKKYIKIDKYAAV